MRRPPTPSARSRPAATTAGRRPDAPGAACRRSPRFRRALRPPPARPPTRRPRCRRADASCALPGSPAATPLMAAAIAGAQRCERPSSTIGPSAVSSAGSAPRKPNTAWLGSPASRVRSAPAASTRTSRAACGSRCWASSTSSSRTLARSAASSSGSVANASRAAPTSSAAPSAGTVACGAAVPTAARSSITCSYCWAKRPAAAHSGRPDNRPMRCSCGGSTPRSAQRARRSRSSVAKPAVPSAGRSCSRPPRQRAVPVLEVTGQQLADDAVLLGAGDQPRRRIAGPRGRLAQHRERITVHRAHQRLAHHGTARLAGPRLEQRGRQRAARGGGQAAPNPSAAEPIPGPSRRRCARRPRATSSVLLPVPGPPTMRTVPRSPGASTADGCMSSGASMGLVMSA